MGQTQRKAVRKLAYFIPKRRNTGFSTRCKIAVHFNGISSATKVWINPEITWNKYDRASISTYVLFAGWEIRMVKNSDRGLENAACRRRAAFSMTIWNDQVLRCLENANYHGYFIKILFQMYLRCPRFSFVITLTMINKVNDLRVSRDS